MSRPQWYLAALVCALIAGVTIWFWPWAPWRNQETVILGHITSKDWQAAETALARSFLGPPQKQLLLARIRLGQGRPEGALKELESLPPEARQAFEFRLLSGRAFLALGQAAPALVLFDLAQQERPADPEAVRGLAGALYDLGVLERAYGILTGFLAAHQDPFASRFAGQIAKELGKFDEAADHFEAALKGTWEDATESQIRLDLLEVSLERNDLPKAQSLWRDWENAQAKFGTRETARSLTLGGRVALLSGQTEKAETMLDQARTLDPIDGSIARLRAQVWLDRGQPGEAIPLLELAIRQDPLDTSAWNLLAQAFDARGNQEKAREVRKGLETAAAQLKKMSELNQKANANPADIEVRRELARFCRSVNRPKLAEIWEKAAKDAEGLNRPSPEKPRP